MVASLVLSVLNALADNQVRYTVVGGVALNLIGLARATQDLDIFVAPDEENVARLRQALKQVFSDPDIDGITSSDLNGDYPVVQYIPPSGGFHIDIISRLGEAYRYDSIEAEQRWVEGIPVCLATPRMLYKMKHNTIRLQDQADAARIARYFDVED